MPATSPAAERLRGGNGFALYELVLALAIMGLVASVVLPRLVRAPGPIEVKTVAEEIAAVLRTDRNAALAGRRDVVTGFDLADGMIEAGSSNRIVAIPRAIEAEFVQSSRELAAGSPGIRFLADGRSSGGTLTLTRQDFSYRVSVNWLTAGVRVSRAGPDG